MATVIVNHFLAEKLGVDINATPTLNIPAASVKQLITVLAEQFPSAKDHLTQGVAIAVDDEILQNPLFESLNESSEIYFLPAIEAG